MYYLGEKHTDHPSAFAEHKTATVLSLTTAWVFILFYYFGTEGRD